MEFHPARLVRHWTCNLFLAAILLAAADTALASRVRPLNLEEMTQRAARIFSGRCVGVQVARDPSLGRMVTYVSLAVTRTVKGGPRGQVTIKLLGEEEIGSAKDRGIEGLPRFQRGEEVALFLYGESASGLTSPVGFGQGKFSIVKDKQGRKLAVNGFRNDNLFRNLTPGGEHRLGDAVSKLRGRREIPLDELLDMAEALAR